MLELDQFVAVRHEEYNESGTTIFALASILWKAFTLSSAGTDVQALKSYSMQEKQYANWLENTLEIA